MRLSIEALKERGFWEKAGIALPGFDIQQMRAQSEAAPKWLHFGAGNIFRAFPAAVAQSLLNQGLEKAGIVVAARYDRQTIERCFGRYDNLTLLVTLKSDGTTEKSVLASIASYLSMNEERERLSKIFTNPALQLASFIITEKGYNLRGADGNFAPDVAGDLAAKPAAASSFFGTVSALCYERYLAGAKPLALVSMDNCSYNGDLLFSVIETFAKNWTESGAAEAGFLDYVRDRGKLSFPCTMIDKITPGPDDGVRDMLAACGLEDMQGGTAGKSTLVAPFVNAEETGYLVIEDSFPNGRPALEKAAISAGGVLFADRETVARVEKMKVGTCLNPLHTALAVFGCLLGYTRISAEMKDADLVKLVRGIGLVEGLPVVVDPGIIKPADFIGQVINLRFPNPFMPDSPQRIATDTSQKIPVRFGGTLKAYKSAGKDLGDLKLIPLVFAGWLRYLLGLDDEGRPFKVSPDPLYESLSAHLAGIKLGEGGGTPGALGDTLKPILSRADIFGLDLYEAGLAGLVEGLFVEMISGTGAVRKTLSRMTA
ncbi:MAG: mannitol dehydrogenase family protein [Spirochaetes bacterium]|nr:mannitol dehydrogenase family protein [Spirochaetota bacterium]